VAHPVPKDLKGEERFLTIPYTDLYLNKTGAIYNGSATLLAGIIGKLTNNAIVFLALLVLLNIAVYPLAQTTIKKSLFDGGGVRRDKFLMKQYSYKKKKNVYLRRIKN